MATTVTRGDLISLKEHHCGAMGIVLEVIVPESAEPRAKILMHNGGIYQFLIDDLIIHSKGDNHESI